MIELDVVAYLKADTTLDTLLSATGTDSKIYPIQAPQERTIPYIIYTISSEGTLEENLNEETISFNCISDNYIEAKNIVDRLDALLDHQSDIRTLVSSESYYIYWCKKVGGSTFIDPESKQKDFYHRVSVYDFKYNPFSISLPSAAVEPTGLEKVISFPYYGTVKVDTIFDNMQLGQKTIFKVGLHLQNAGTIDVITDLTVNSVAQSRLATLTAGSRQQTQPSDITNLILGGNDLLGAKINQGDGEGLVIDIYYR